MHPGDLALKVAHSSVCLLLCLVIMRKPYWSGQKKWILRGRENNERRRLWMKPFFIKPMLSLWHYNDADTQRLRQGHIWMLQTTKDLMLAADITAVRVAISFGSSVFFGWRTKWEMGDAVTESCFIFDQQLLVRQFDLTLASLIHCTGWTNLQKVESRCRDVIKFKYICLLSHCAASEESIKNVYDPSSCHQSMDPCCCHHNIYIKWCSIKLNGEQQEHWTKDQSHNRLW